MSRILWSVSLLRSCSSSKRLQLALTVAGYYDGPVDGDLGSGSRDAVRSFQLSLGINADGVATRDLLQRLESPR